MMIAHSKCVMVIVLTHSLTELSVHTPHYENVPFEVPKGWVWTTLGSISNYGTSINVQVGDIDSNEWILELEDIEKDTAKIIQHLSKKERFLNGTRHKFQKGDILYSKLRTYLNKVLVASNGGFCSTEIMPFGTYGVLSNEYICHVLRSNHFLDYTLRCGYGVKMPRLSTNDACKGMIPLPPLAEQQRIVTEIEKWFSLIDQIEQGKDDLHSIVKQTKSKILDLAIHGELVPQDPNDEPAIELLKRINPSFTPCDNGHYPVGWIDVILGDIFYHNTGKALNSSNKEGVLRNYLTTSNVYWNQFDLSLVKQMPFRDNELEKCTVQKGDLLVCEGGDVGRSAIWNFDYNICIQNHIHRLRPKGDLNVSFYYYVLRFLKKHNRIGGKGIGLLGLSSNELHKIGMPLPPRKEQDRIVLKIEELFSVLDNIQNALEA
jgi:type I restriction enzyme S subunit|uniref:restriction endonuclease subunit S n=4 Tax=Bacteroidia TaxID=200643 RepID=UPI00216B311E|nr:restriction endonuclease subunit S [Bacteroides thetaiotaomicron]